MSLGEGDMTHHPCGAVPVRGWILSVWHCECHQAFWASATSYVQSGGDSVEQADHAGIEFGPFDDLPTIHAWIREQWLRWDPVRTHSPH
jgi:hypothetical protein